MTLTNNETAWAVMAITLVYSSVQAWVVIKIQTAKDIEMAKEEIKNKFVRLVLWISNLSAVTLLLFEFISSAPISRMDVFLIVWSAALLIMSVMLELIVIMKEMMRLHKYHAISYSRFADLLEHTLDIMPNQADSPDQKAVR